MKTPTKAIIPAAGLGTRFLPQTKAMPKEMLPIIDKPVVQRVVEELVDVGVTEVIIVTGAQKRAIEDHFDRDMELESVLKNKGKTQEVEEVKRIAEMANFVYIRQKGEPQGNARPVLNAEHLLSEDEAFFVFFPDDFFRTTNGKSRAMQLLEAHEKTGGTVISLLEVEREQVSAYGVAECGDAVDENTFKITKLVEKPDPDKAPSNFVSVGGYILTPDIFPILRKEKTGVGGELILADAINELAQNSSVYGKIIEGVYHDAGNKMKYVEAIADLTLADPKLGSHFRKYLETRLQEND